MRSLLSYFFLITLLFPTVVETIHAIEDSHDICDDISIHFHKENQSCDLALYFSIDLQVLEPGNEKRRGSISPPRGPHSPHT